MTHDGSPRPAPQLALSLPELSWLYRGTIEPRYRGAVQMIPEDELACWLLLSGSVELESGGPPERVEPGALALLSAGRWATRWEPDSQLVSVRCRLPLPRTLRLFDARGLLWVRGMRVPELARATAALGEWCVQHPTPHRVDLRSGSWAPADFLRLRLLYAAWVEALHQAMASLDRLEHPTSLDPRLVKALASIQEDPLRSEQSLARALGLSLSHLQRLFRQQLGCPIHRLADEVRLQRAKALLAAPDVLVKEAAAAAGFASAQAFARWFRQRTGCSPVEHQARTQRRV